MMVAANEVIGDLPVPPPSDSDGPVFAEPWQAQVFAMTLQLHQEGRFTWSEWVEVFSREIADAAASGDPDLGNTYYDHWLVALEKIVARKNIISDDERFRRQRAWKDAAAATPHGEPIQVPE